MTKLKKLIKEKGTKQEWLAAQLGVTQTTVSHWCTGKRKPRYPMVLAIARILNVEPEEIL